MYIWYVRPHFSSTVLGLRNVGGVKCQPFLNIVTIGNGTKIIFKGSGCFQFPEAVITSTAKASLHSIKRGSIQVLAVL